MSALENLAWAITDYRMTQPGRAQTVLKEQLRDSVADGLRATWALEDKLRKQWAWLEENVTGRTTDVDERSELIGVPVDGEARAREDRFLVLLREYEDASSLIGEATALLEAA